MHNLSPNAPERNSSLTSDRIRARSLECYLRAKAERRSWKVYNRPLHRLDAAQWRENWNAVCEAERRERGGVL